MKNLTLFLTSFLLATSLYGQYQIGLIPRTSPDKGVYQKIGFTEVEVRYGSPSAKERDIWGSLVPYNVVWRAGANNATTIEFSTAVKVDGKSLTAGKYAFFLIPREQDKWTAIFNKTHDQWGAFKYDETQDALRVEVQPRYDVNQSALWWEELKYSIHNQGHQYGQLEMDWAGMQISLELDTNYSDQFRKIVEERISKTKENSHWVIYLQGAEHLVDIEGELQLAADWIQKSKKSYDPAAEWNEQYYPQSHILGHLHWTEAKLLALQGDYASALSSAQKMKGLDESIYYKKKKDSQAIDMKMSEWKQLSRK